MKYVIQIARGGKDVRVWESLTPYHASWREISERPIRLDFGTIELVLTLDSAHSLGPVDGSKLQNAQQ